jgi:hypothetical protein
VGEARVSPALVLAGQPGAAERAARWLSGDAVVHVGDPAALPAGTVDVHHVVISGDLADREWVSASFRSAGAVLAAGGRITVVLATEGDAPASEMVALPPDVLAGWRVSGLSVEHPGVAATFARAVDHDSAFDSADLFRRALAAWVAYSAEAGHERSASRPVAIGDDVGQDEDAEFARLRRELARYRDSTFGRVARTAWALRSRLGRLRRSVWPKSSA